MNYSEDIKIRKATLLPHWEKEGGIYFVTFRLSDSLPQNVLDQYREERKQLISKLELQNNKLTNDEKKQLHRLFSDRIDKYLANGYGNCYLKDQRVSSIVIKALEHFDNQRYINIAWCVMPNHVHIILKILPDFDLANILHSWKSYTANKANNILNRTGTFWAREYYDHLIRDEDDLNRIIEYVIYNPLKANLKNWDLVWLNHTFVEIL